MSGESAAGTDPTSVEPLRSTRIQSSSPLQLVSGAFLSTDSDGAQRLNLAGRPSIGVTTEQAAAIEIFSTPRTLENGVHALRARFTHFRAAEALTIVADLVDAEQIVPFSPDLHTEPDHHDSGMFGCPLTSLAAAVLGDASDVVFVGMPYEMGVTGRPGASSGPSYLRTCSRAAFDYAELQGVPRGWWHAARQRRVLEEVRLVDIGDIECGDSHRNGVAFDRLGRTVETLLRAGRTPVVLGGDHSITLAAIEAAALVRPGLGVVHFDAHSDLGATDEPGDWRTHCDHSNFMSWLVVNPNVASITQLGVRNTSVDSPTAHPKISTFPGHGWVGDIDRIVAALDDQRPYYVTFDVDCLDPQLISLTGTPVPGGLGYREIKDAIAAISKRLNIVACDIVELASPNEPSEAREGFTVSYLIFELLAGVFERRASGQTRS